MRKRRSKSEEKRQIDIMFSKMSSDTEYQREAAQISQAFSHSDWEAFERAEKDSQKGERS
jgi:hypothetical protein